MYLPQKLAHGKSMKTFVLTLLFLLPVMSFANSSKSYTCTAPNLAGKTVTITTNTDAYGSYDEESFTVASKGLFPEFKGFDYDLAVCAYEGMFGNESFKNGMSCQGMSIGGGQDYKTSFIISSNELKLQTNPRSFSAVIKYGANRFYLTCR
jgi:hypothetical protein